MSPFVFRELYHADDPSRPVRVDHITAAEAECQHAGCSFPQQVWVSVGDSDQAYYCRDHAPEIGLHPVRICEAE